jgi:hypothetical protein
VWTRRRPFWSLAIPLVLRAVEHRTQEEGHMRATGESEVIGVFYFYFYFLPFHTLTTMNSPLRRRLF